MLDIELIDVRAEMEKYEWERAKWSDMKLIAVSPFRSDNSPSFYVWLDGDNKGYFGDSGGDDEFRRGGIVKLLSFLRNETYEDTMFYLTEEYGASELSEGDFITIPSLTLGSSVRRITLDETQVLGKYMRDYEYLRSRGISSTVQEYFDVKYVVTSKSVAIPWRHADGALANVKYRRTEDKLFWYESDAAPIRSLVFALDKVYEDHHTTVYITEAEIDAMSMWQAGKAAIALGTASLSEIQVELILKSPITKVIIATDSDAPGDKVARQIRDAFSSEMEVTRVNWGEHKDANAYLLNKFGPSVE